MTLKKLAAERTVASTDFLLQRRLPFPCRDRLLETQDPSTTLTGGHGSLDSDMPVPSFHREQTSPSCTVSDSTILPLDGDLSLDNAKCIESSTSRLYNPVSRSPSYKARIDGIGGTAMKQSTTSLRDGPP